MKQRKIEGEVVQSTIRLGTSLYKEISKIAHEREMSISALIEEILDTYVNEGFDTRKILTEVIAMKANSTNSYNYSSFFDSALGTVFVVTESGTIKRILYGKESFENFKAETNAANLIEGGDAEECVNKLKLYMTGKAKEFQPKLDLSSGTPFQISVWKKLMEIPYGEVKTYGEIAQELGRPNAYRAVGNAVGANPIPIIVPCHRVVATNGRLGGYTGGLDKKKKLLQVEGVLS